MGNLEGRCEELVAAAQEHEGQVQELYSQLEEVAAREAALQAALADAERRSGEQASALEAQRIDHTDVLAGLQVRNMLDSTDRFQSCNCRFCSQ